MVNARECCKCFTVSLVPVTVFCLAVVFLGGIVILPTLFVELANQQQYGLVIDAGSTHTGFFLYKWYLPKPNNSATGQIFETKECPDDTMYARPAGISSFVNNPSAAGPNIKNCTTHLLQSAPKDIRPNITIYLGATAGMRLVHEQTPNASDAILASVDQTLEDLSGNHSVRIITGMEEATSGWVTVNYLNQTFIASYPLKRSLNSRTIGSLDMGGASMQISFVPRTPPPNEYADNITVFGSVYTLYSRSYLCYGYNEVLRRLSASLAEKEKYVNPCLLKDAKVNITGSDLFGDHYCTEEFEFGGRNLSENITFTGSGNASACSQVLQELNNFTASAGGTVPAEGNFIGFSSFYHTADFFNTTQLNKRTFDNFTNVVKSFCNYTVKEAREQADIKYQTYAEYYCFGGLYVLHVLNDGFGFNSNTTKDWSVQFANKVNVTGDGTTPNIINYGWALGYMLLRTQDIPLSPYYIWRPYTVVDLVMGIIVLAILCFVFIVFFVFTCTACHRALKTTTAGYSNIA